MLTRIYIDNYKSFVNFEFRPQKLQLILGDNGSGKTAFFEVLERLRGFIQGTGVESKHLFPAASLTAWEQRALQTFELDAEIEGREYRYRLVMAHDEDRLTNRIHEEKVELDDKPLYVFDGQDVRLYLDDFSPGAVFPFDGTRSALATVPERKDYRLLTVFRSFIGRVLLFAPNPLSMQLFSEAEQAVGDRELTNIVSWLRHLSQTSIDSMSELQAKLRDNVLTGLQTLRLDQLSDKARVLRFVFNAPNGSSSRQYTLLLHQISDGQRQLLGLYTILLGAVNDGAVVCIDEPDNYVALPEIQPWLIELGDRIEDTSSQCFLISHHPEALNYLAAENGIVFERENGGPTRISPFGVGATDAIAPADYVVRGGQY